PGISDLLLVGDRSRLVQLVRVLLRGCELPGRVPRPGARRLQSRHEALLPRIAALSIHPSVHGVRIGATMRAVDVFEPASLGPIQLRNRVLKAATYEGM